MNAIKKLIPNANIASEYRIFVEEFTSTIKKKISDLHSIYMCGSIPKGTAVPYTSDADFTVVLKNQASSEIKEIIQESTFEIQQRFPIVPKIDVPICTVQDVIGNRYDWGFWIKIVSICIDGPDLSYQLPDIYPSFELQKTYYEAAIEQVPNSIETAISETNNVLRTIAQRKSIKKIIRAIYSLYIRKEKSWTEDIEEFISVIERYSKNDVELIHNLINSYRAQDLSRSDFKKIAHEAMEFYLEQYANMVNNTT